MNLAILFWFYKEPEICQNRLELLKKKNPEVKIYGLFGGEPSEAQKYQEKLGEYFDDFYAFTGNKESNWKWINGDLLILDWYEHRGRNLDWDSISIIQWDMLVFDSLKNQFPEIKPGEIYFSGLKELDEETENNWWWTKPNGEERQNYLNFLEYVKQNFTYTSRALCCLFILEIFPRIFFDKYLSVSNKEVGMLEYKNPTYAKIFELPFYKRDLGVRWHENSVRPLNAIPEEIPTEYIKSELEKPQGWRIFHPYFKMWSIDK